MKLLVIGDSCEDVFVYGECGRLAPAAPVPVFVEKNRKINKGMAGNIYRNLIDLGAECDIITNRNVITKTRYVEEKTNHMLVRIDSGEEKIKKVDNLHLVEFAKYSAIIISDYDKGFLSHEDIRYIASQHELVFLDSKKLLGEWAKHINFIKINEVEYEKTKHLLPELKSWVEESLLITLGSEGCRYKNKIFPVQKVEVRDLTGAGDSFLAGLVYEYLSSGNIEKSIVYGNKCATKVVQMRGVNTVNDV